MVKKLSNKYDKMDKKPQSEIKKDKSLSKDKVKLIKNVLLEEVDVKRKEVKSDDVNTDNSDEILNLCEGFDRKNVFEVLMKPSNGGYTTPNKPRRSYKKKRIGSTPKSSDQKSIREWLKNE